MYIPIIGPVPDEVVEKVKEILKEEEIFGQPSNLVKAIKWIRNNCGVSLHAAKVIAEHVSYELNVNEFNLPKMAATFLCGTEELMKVHLLRIKSFSFEVRETIPGKITVVSGDQNDIMELIGKMAEGKMFSLYKAEIL